MFNDLIRYRVLRFADQSAETQRSRISLPVCLCEGIDEIDA